MNKCYVRWENRGEWRGPFTVTDYGNDWVELHRISRNAGMVFLTIPRSWTIGIDGGWTVWTGGERPLAGKVLVTRRDAREVRGVAQSFRWYHEANYTDIIAYRVVEEPSPSLSVILSHWWIGDQNQVVFVSWISPDRQTFWLSNGERVPPTWFTGREHHSAEELEGMRDAKANNT